MYVAMFEILEREKSKKEVSGLIQLLAIVIGFSTMLMLEILGTYNY